MSDEPTPKPPTANPPAAKPAAPKFQLPPLVPFVSPKDRQTIDQAEPAADGSRPNFQDREWIGYAQQGGKLPEDWHWPHSPKQEQDEAM